LWRCRVRHGRLPRCACVKVVGAIEVPPGDDLAVWWKNSVSPSSSHRGRCHSSTRCSISPLGHPALARSASMDIRPGQPCALRVDGTRPQRGERCRSGLSSGEVLGAHRPPRQSRHPATEHRGASAECRAYVYR
jgi:hypothetical protein